VRRATLVGAALAVVVAVAAGVVAARQAGSDDRSDERGAPTTDPIADLRRVFRTARTASDGLRFKERGRPAVAIDGGYSAFCGPWEMTGASIPGEGPADPPAGLRTERTIRVAGFGPRPDQWRSWLLRVAPARVAENERLDLARLVRMDAPPVALSVQMAPKRSFSSERGARGWIQIHGVSCPPSRFRFSVHGVVGSTRGGPPLAVRGTLEAVFAPPP
jgi:hypothetical protein